MFQGRIAAIGLLILAVGPAGTAEEPEGGLTREERQRRLAFMRTMLAEFRFELDRDPPLPLALPEEPALHYTNPVRDAKAGGATFFLLRDGRPLAAASVSIRAEGQIFHEFTALGDEPIVARREGLVDWTPRKNGRSFSPLDGAEAPTGSAVLRLAQMRKLSQRFRLRVLRDVPFEARLLPQPLLRYTHAEAGSPDGAVFAFVEATDPEAFLLLEARPDDAHPNGRWHFSLAKMTSRPIEVLLDDRPIWAVPGYWRNPTSPDDPYLESSDGIYTPGPRQ
jgi:hypothetical protein